MSFLHTRSPTEMKDTPTQARLGQYLKSITPSQPAFAATPSRTFGTPAFVTAPNTVASKASASPHYRPFAQAGDVSPHSDASVRTLVVEHQTMLNLSSASLASPILNEMSFLSAVEEISMAQGRVSSNSASSTRSLDHRSLLSQSLDGSCLEIGEPVSLNESITLGILGARVYVNFIEEIERAQKEEEELAQREVMLETARQHLLEEQQKLRVAHEAEARLKALQEENDALERYLTEATKQLEDTYMQRNQARDECFHSAKVVYANQDKLRSRVQTYLKLEERYHIALEELDELRQRTEQLDENRMQQPASTSAPSRKVRRHLSKEVEELNMLRVDNSALELELANLDKLYMTQLLNDEEPVEESDNLTALNETIMMSDRIPQCYRALDVSAVIEDSIIM
jgi:hypothetical protein